MECFEEGTANMDTSIGIKCENELKYEQNDVSVASLPSCVCISRIPYFYPL